MHGKIAYVCVCVCSVSLYINKIKLLIYLVIIHYKLPVKLCFKTLFVFEHVTLKYMRYCSNWLSHIFLPCVYLTSTIIFQPSSYTCGRFQSQFVVVRSLNHVWLFAAWTAAFQASLSFTISEFAQTHIHWGNDAIQLFHLLSPPSPSALSLTQHQSLSQWVNLCIRWLKYWSFSLSISPLSEYSSLSLFPFFSIFAMKWWNWSHDISFLNVEL